MHDKAIAATTNRRRRLMAAAAAGIALVIVLPTPADADPAVPTHYESSVTRVDPEPVGMTIEIEGGDAFLAVSVEPGHEVIVPGYFGEPYVWIDTDGVVRVNARSPARSINDDRYGRTPAPDDADASAEPLWEQVGTGGSYAWHDHRVHWMSADRPPNVAGDVVQEVFPWSLVLQLDATEVTVQGRLAWFPSVSPVGPMLAGLVGLLPLLRWRRRHLYPIAVTLAIGGGLALFGAWVDWTGTPASARSAPVGVVIAAVALIAAVAGSALVRRGAAIASGALALGATALVVWAFRSLDVLTLPVLPSPISAAVQRIALAAVIWIGFGTAALVVGEVVRRRPPSGSHSGIAP